MQVLGTCNTGLELDSRILEKIPPIVGWPCNILKEIQKPPRRLYIRVNTLKITVEEYLELAAQHGIKLNRDEEIPEALWAPVKGPFKPGVYSGRVIADKKASESVLMGSDLYAPGVKWAGGFVRGKMVSVYSENGIHVGSGIAVMDPEEMRRARRGLAVRVTEPVWKSVRVNDLPGYSEGFIYGQSLPSMYVARLLDPSREDRVLDVTAAPGGKITHVIQLSRGARAIAVDRKSKRGVLAETFRRLGMIRYVEVVGGDSTKLSRVRPHLIGWPTKVIVDPPCSNLGVRPKVYINKNIKDIVNVVRYQRAILFEAARIAAPGALISYSTCTLTSDENDAMIAWAIEKLGLEPIEPSVSYKRPRKGGFGYWFSPLDGIPGFYIALLRKPQR